MFRESLGIIGHYGLAVFRSMKGSSGVTVLKICYSLEILRFFYWSVDLCEESQLSDTPINDL